MFDWDALLLSLRAFGLRLTYAAGIFLLGLFLIRYLLKLLVRVLAARRLDEGLYAFVLSLVKITLIVLLSLICASFLDINVTPVVTALGAVGLALSLAVKDSLANLAGGVFILVTKPFGRGDYVDIGGTEGSVREIGLLHSILTTPDNKKIYIPNGDIAKAVIINYSAEPTRRLDLTFSVPRGADLARAKEILLALAGGYPGVLAEPPPMARATEFGENSVSLLCRFWVQNEKLWDARFDLTEQIRKALDDAGLPVPLNRVSVRMEQPEP